MSMPFQRSAATAAVLLAFALASAAQPAGQQGSGAAASAAKPAQEATRATGGSMDRTDRQFLERAATGGMMEVELGQLAQQKASNAKVKEFGARMVSDHGKSNDQLKQIATSKGAQPPASVDTKHRQDMQKLESMQGMDFDREYMRHMVADHRKDIAEYRKQAESGKDADLKAFAAQTLPTLQEHLKLAQSVNDALGAKSKAAGPKTPS